MLDLELIVSNGDRLTTRHESHLRALGNIDKMKREFIELCIQRDPDQRPTAHELLKHPVLQEVCWLAMAVYNCNDFIFNKFRYSI